MKEFINKKAKHNYLLKTKFEAGVILLPQEIKSIILNQFINFDHSYASVKNGEVFIYNLLIKQLKSNTRAANSREIKLLLHKKEIMHIVGSINKQGHTLVPTKAYFKGNLLKIELCLAHGLSNIDKRWKLRYESEKKINTI